MEYSVYWKMNKISNFTLDDANISFDSKFWDSLVRARRGGGEVLSSAVILGILGRFGGARSLNCDLFWLLFFVGGGYEGSYYRRVYSRVDYLDVKPGWL